MSPLATTGIDSAAVPAAQPPDLRPPVFADSCADPRARHERARTLVTFLARAGRLHNVLEWIGSTRLEASNADLPKVVELAMRWRGAFAG